MKEASGVAKTRELKFRKSIEPPPLPEDASGRDPTPPRSSPGHEPEPGPASPKQADKRAGKGKKINLLFIDERRAVGSKLLHS